MGNCASSKAGLKLTDVTLGEQQTAHAGPRVFSGPHLDDPVNNVSCGSKSGEWLSCGEDSVVSLTNWQEGSVSHMWHGHKKGVNCVVPATQLDGAVSAGRDCTIKLWNRGKQEIL